ncbi:alpha/beta hydrolase [Octadecabacter sp. G9-8]|uniref:Alpha/beta hydrolase n=1 Tax=Octadecabacter dasysiphoniae TaxID=2909341 RepID=A0ABS9D2Q8_9RHOB|nr:alpha/beta hydrolase [Octadecabacter dasysiphoniae]
MGTISPAPNHLIWRGGQVADTVTQAQFLDDIRGQSTSGDVLIWVHGFNTSRSIALATTKKIKATVTGQGFQGTVISYDWPTSSENGLRGLFNRLFGLQRMYKKDKDTANAMDDTLIKDLKFLFDAPGINVHIMAHSMGCYLTTLGIRHAESWLGNSVPFGQIIMGAADVDQVSLVDDDWFGKSINRRCQRVTHYHSTDDDILDVGGQVMYGGSKRSGRHGLKANAPDRFVDVSMAERFNKQHPNQELRLSHNWYLHDDIVLRDAAITLGGQDAGAMPTRNGSASGWNINKA